MAPAGSLVRRSLASEGRRLLRECCGSAPFSLLKNYVRSAERRPAVEFAGVDAKERDARRLLSVRVLEASPLGATLMMSRRRRGIVWVALRLGFSLFADAAGALRRMFGRPPPRARGR